MLFYFLFNNFESVRKAVSGFIQVFRPIIYGFAIAYILNPSVNFFERKLKKSKKLKFKKENSTRSWAMVITYVLAIALISIFLLIIIPNLVTSARTLIDNISRYIANIDTIISEITEKAQKYIADITFLSDQLENLASGFEGIVNTIVTWLRELLPEALNMVAKLSEGILNVFIGVMVSIYMLAGKERFSAQIKKLMLAFFRKEHVDKTIVFFRNLHSVIGGYLSGVIIDSFLVGVVTFILLSLFGISFPLLISVIIAVTNVIPFFGPFLGAVPSGFILLVIDPIQAVIFAVLILVIQQIDGNIIAPKILGHSTGIPSIFVVVAILVGGNLFGFWGMLLGVPFFALFYQIVRTNVAKRLEDKGMPSDTEYYFEYMHAEPSVLLSERTDIDDKHPKKLVEKIFYFAVKWLKWLWTKVKAGLIAAYGFIKRMLSKLFEKIGSKKGKKK